MSISNCLKDNLIASTSLNKALVPGLDGATTGPIASNVGLDQIAQNVAVNMNMANAPSRASHARPSMFAFVSSFAQNVQTALNAVAPGQPLAVYSGLDQRVKEDFAEWQGLIAAVALHNIYSCVGLELSVDTVLLNSDHPAHRCILWEMDKDADYRTAVTGRDPLNAPTAGQLFYIRQKGRPFAIFHPIIGLCPMQTYDDSMFDGVLPWHHTHDESCHKGWTSIAEPSQNAFLSDFCLSRIAWWAGQNQLTNYGTYLTGRMSKAYVPNASLVSGQTVPQAASIDNVWPGRGTSLGCSMMLYPAQGGRLPNLFLDSILISYVGDGNNRMVYNTSAGEKPIGFVGDPEALKAYAPVPPFCPELVKLLDSCTLEDISFEAKIVNSGLTGVLTTVRVCNQFGESFTVERRYDAAHLRQGKLPYMMIWPYVEMPAGMNLWKEYYATWDNTDEAMSLLRNANGETVSIVSNMTFRFQAPASAHNVCCPTRQMEGWEVCTSSEPFRQAVLLGKQDGEPAEMGLVFMPAYKTYEAVPGSAKLVTNPVKVAVDFGTTSTVCAISTPLLNGGNTFPLEFRDYSHTVTCENQRSKENLDVFHWLGNPEGGAAWKWDTKIFSIAQLFDRVGTPGPDHHLLGVAGQQDYYVDARMCMLSGNAMSNFAAAAQGTKDPLRSQKIMNDMKFNDTLDVETYHAASAFLAGIYTYTVLYLLHNKVVPITVPSPVAYLELLSSYPNDVTLSALRYSWTHAKTIVDRMINATLTSPIQNLLMANQFYSEAAATAAYQLKPGRPLAAAKGVISLDIGGGTTDISITDVNHPGDVRMLSVRYAGREMMVSTLVEYFRRFHSQSQVDRQSMFAKLWQGNDVQLMSQFLQLCDPVPNDRFSLKQLSANGSLRMYIELLLSEGMNFPRAADDLDTVLLRQLIALKFMMVMRIAARAVRENKDLWYAPGTETLAVFDNVLPLNISVSGTSAQLLQYVFDCQLNDLIALSAGSAPTPQMQQCMELFNAMFTDELKAVLPQGVKADITIFVNQDIKEKREVAYGMMESTIGTIAPAPASAPVGLWTMPGAPGAAAAANAALIAQRQTELRNYSAQELQKFIKGQWDENGQPISLGLLNYIKAYENIFFGVAVAANRGLGHVNSVYDLLSNFLPYFPASQMTVSNSHAKYMVEPEQEKYLDLLACIYFVEDILDAQMAELQTH